MPWALLIQQWRPAAAVPPGRTTCPTSFFANTIVQGPTRLVCEAIRQMNRRQQQRRQQRSGWVINSRGVHTWTIESFCRGPSKHVFLNRTIQSSDNDDDAKTLAAMTRLVKELKQWWQAKDSYQRMHHGHKRWKFPLQQPHTLEVVF